ncbi:MAG: VOC family protein [Acidimicrobiales bacterium]
MEELPAPPDWRGISHLALVTPDMDETVRFYAGVLGMPLVLTMMAGPMRHYFFEISPGNTVAFFEIEGAETFQSGAGSPAPYPVQLDHLSFNVPDEHALEVLADRIRAAGSEVTDIVDHGVMKSVYFTDNNGIALEASYWVIDGTGRHFDPEDADLAQDPDPVPAVAELAGHGLQELPTTKLV